VHRKILEVGLALALAIALPGTASAQDYEAAGKHFAAAQEAFTKGNYNRAADEFESAYTITKDPVLLYNIGEAYEKAGNGRAAVRNYRKYVAEQPQATDRAEVERRIGALEKKYKLEPPAPTPITPPPAPQLPGKTTEKPGPAVKTPEKAPPAPVAPPPEPVKPAAKEGLLQLGDTPPPDPEKAPPPAAAPEKEPAPAAGGLLDEDKPSTTKVVAWIGVATTVALLTAGAIFGLAAQSRSDEISRREKMVGSDNLPLRFDMMTEQQFKDLRSEGQTYDAVGITLLTGAGVVAVVSGVLFFVDHSSKSHAETHVRLTPSLGPKQAGLAARWEF
jgi:hypothetical protein